MCCLVVQKKYEIETFFPVMEGIPSEVCIRGTHTWGNGLEGEVEVELNGFDLFFFAPFYKQDFSSLEKSTRTNISFSGLAFTIEDAMMEFEINKGPLYESSLNEFLKENPGKNKNDFKNPVANMDGLVALFPTSYHLVYQYRGIIKTLEYINFYERKIAKTKVCIKRGENKEKLIHIYLYIPLNCCKDCELKIGKDIQGIFWLQGVLR